MNPLIPFACVIAAPEEQAQKIRAEVEVLANEKKALQRRLRQFETDFERAHNRHPKVRITNAA